MTQPAPETPELITRGMELKAHDKAARTARFVCSSESIDSYGDIVEQTFNLTRYLRNPVVLFAHNSRELPIGHASEVGVVNGQLEATITFVSAKANPLAENVWQSICEESLRAVSIGFYPNDVRIEQRDGVDVVVLSNNEIFEISVTPIGANPDALKKMRARALGRAPEPAALSGQKDPPMDRIKELEGIVSERDAAIAAVRSELAVATLKASTLEAQNGVLVTQRDAAIGERDVAVKTAKALEDAGIEAEVEALVGVKIVPAEKAAYVELRRSNPGLFKSMVAQRLDLKLLGPTGLESKTHDAPGTATGGVDLNTLAQERAQKEASL